MDHLRPLCVLLAPCLFECLLCIPEGNAAIGKVCVLYLPRRFSSCKENTECQHTGKKKEGTLHIVPHILHLNHRKQSDRGVLKRKSCHAP